MTRAVVVGAGMAGLVAAAYLAKDGFDVDVFEQSDAIGGVTRTIEKNGYKWDIGPMIIETLAPDEPGGQVLRELGCMDKIKLIPGEKVS